MTLRVIIDLMIKSFKCKETQSIWDGNRSRKLPNNIQTIARRKLRMLNNAQYLSDLRVAPANRLEKLRGDRESQHSIRINKQWRICFIWRSKGASQVEIVDYH